MGMTHLEEIMGIFGKYKPANYPVGIVQNGTLENEKWVTGTLETITDIVKKEGISNPATVFVVWHNRFLLQLGQIPIHHRP